MALDTIALPYGIRDIKLTPYTDAAGTTLADTSVDLPYARTLSFTDQEDFDDLRGDDRVVASHGQGPTVAWELESGGIPLEAWAILSGGNVGAVAGTTPNQTKTFTKKVTDSRPYFRIEGQAISDSGGDVRVVLPRCKANDDLDGEFSDGSFFLTKGKGTGYGSLVAGEEDILYQFIQAETVSTFVEPGV